MIAIKEKKCAFGKTCKQLNDLSSCAAEGTLEEEKERQFILQILDASYWARNLTYIISFKCIK